MRGVPRCEDHTSSDAQRGGRRGCITEMMSLRAVLAPVVMRRCLACVTWFMATLRHPQAPL